MTNFVGPLGRQMWFLNSIIDFLESGIRKAIQKTIQNDDEGPPSGSLRGVVRP